MITINLKNIEIIPLGTVSEGGGTNNNGTAKLAIEKLTQEKYDSLTKYDDNTFYVITDAEEPYYTKDEIDEMLGNVSTKITEINDMI